MNISVLILIIFTYLMVSKLLYLLVDWETFNHGTIIFVL